MAKSSKLDPARMSTQETAKIFTTVSGHPVSVMQVENDVREGAPRNEDGTMNLVHYGSWLIRQITDVEKG